MHHPSNTTLLKFIKFQFIKKISNIHYNIWFLRYYSIFVTNNHQILQFILFFLEYVIKSTCESKKYICVTRNVILCFITFCTIRCRSANTSDLISELLHSVTLTSIYVFRFKVRILASILITFYHLQLWNHL